MFCWKAQAIFAAVLLAAATGPASAGPALLYDTADGRVLYAEDADQPWYAASLTKMMTAYVTFSVWKAGKAKPDDMITMSANANSRPKMRLGIGAGKQLSFDHAVKALIMKSANDVAVAIAEAISGTEEAFVAEMNATAVRLGMSGTRFINANGLPGEGQHTTAKDMALLAQALITHYPEHLEYFSMTMTEIGDKKKKLIASHNTVLITLEGGDGLKTGFTCSAGYNIVASASRNGQRLVAVILGEQSVAKRTVRASMLLEHGFKTAAWKALAPGSTINSLPESAFDRSAVRVANLEKRFKDCKDPEPPVDPAVIAAATGHQLTPNDPKLSLKTAAVTTGALPSAKQKPGAATAKRAVTINIRKKTAKRPAAEPGAKPAFSLAGQ